MTRGRGVLLAVAGILFISIVALAAFVLAGVTVDLSRWRDVAAGRLAAALERPVRLHGALTLTLGLDSKVHASGIEIPNVPGFSTGEFATLGDVDVRFDLLQAVRGSLRVSRVEADRGSVRLERSADGRANWTSARLAQSSAGAIRIDEIALRNLDLEYLDVGAARHLHTTVDELSASGRADQPLRVLLRAHTASASPYAITLTGEAPEKLLAARVPWPFELVFEHADSEFSARGTVAAGAQLIEISALRGRAAGAEASGQLLADLRGARTRLRGALAVARLDLGPLFGGGGTRTPESFEQLFVRDLMPLDLDIDVSMDELSGVPGDLRDVMLALRVDGGRVHVPMRGVWAGVPLSGELDLDGAAAVPTLALRLEARDTALRDLPRGLVDTPAVSGELGHVTLRADGRGETVGALAGALDLTLSAAARLRFDRGAGVPPLALTLDAVDLSARRGERLHGSGRGTLQGERMTLAFRAGTLSDMVAHRAMPLELDLAAARARLRMTGTLALPGAEEATDLAFDLRAPRVGDLARWLPVASGAKLALDARGRLRTERDAWRLDGATVKLGRSTLTANVRRTRIGGREITAALVRSPLIDVPQLATLRAKGGASIDAPLLPSGIELTDADIDLRLDRVALGRFDLVDFALPAKVRAGRLLPSPIAATLAGTPIAGRVALDLRGVAPDATFDVSARALDVGALLRGLGIAQDIDGRADALDVALRAQGGTLRELAQQSSIEARLTGGSVAVRRATGEGTVAEIGIREATVVAPPGQRLRLHADGTLDATPLVIDVATGALSDFARDARVPLAVTANAGTTHLSLEGEVDLPPGRGGQLVMAMGGERLDALNALARAELPPWGPWSMRGPIRITPTGYAVRDLVVSAGASRLDGTGELDLSGPRPRLDVQVTATDIQLDDFPLPERLTEDARPTLTAQSVRATTRALARRTERLMSVRFLRRLDAYIDVVVKQVYSGTDRLADGALRVQVNDGRLHLGPALVNVPGGTLRLSIAYDPTAPVVDFKAGAYIERFDYGVLARRLHQAEGVRGLFSGRVELAGQAPSLDQIMLYADGQIDFAVWPEDVRGGIFNLWSVNLLLAVLPVIDPGGESHVNCIVGRFDLDDGIVSDDKILIDTTRVRVRGAGSANLRTEALDFVFRPQAKGLALFRLQTPLRVTGTLTDYHIGIDRRDLPESILRMLASPIVVPWQRLTRGPLPRDGADVCTDPLRQ